WPALAHEPDLRNVLFADLRRAAWTAEDTYLIRLFSQFEGLLAFHPVVTRRRPRVPRTAEALFNRVALLERIPDPLRDAVHAVREYRSAIVHPAASLTPPPLSLRRRLL